MISSDVIDERQAKAPPPAPISFEAFWLRVEWLWQRLLPPVLSVLKELGLL